MTRMKWILVLIVVGVLLLGLPPTALQQPAAADLPLGENGPYLVGRQEFSFVDEARGRTVTGYIFYPAGPNATPARPLVYRSDAPPDADAAPYPLIFYSSPRTSIDVTANTTLGAGTLLASYGYAVVSIQHNDPANQYVNLVHRPMDVLFVLDQLAVGGGDGALVGLIDSDHVGVMGFSMGGMTALLLGGAQIDLSGRDAYCATVADPQADKFCAVTADVWQQVIDERVKYDPPVVAGELWPSYSDDRIKVVMPVAPCFGPLFGERGLANASVPNLIVALEQDERCTYERDGLYMYEHLGSPDRALLTMSHQGHDDAIMNRDAQKIFNHFAVAFFGYHLRGEADYAQYLTPEFVSQFDNLMWVSTAE